MLNIRGFGCNWNLDLTVVSTSGNLESCNFLFDAINESGIFLAQIFSAGVGVMKTLVSFCSVSVLGKSSWAIVEV